MINIRIATIDQMIYVNSMPWMLRLLLISNTAMRNKYVETEYIKIHNMSLICVGAILVFIATSLPSLVFSVRDRRLTTSFFANTFLMYLALLSLACYALGSDQYKQYTCILMQFMLAHIFHSQYHYLNLNKHTLIYNSACQYLFLLCSILFPLLLTPQNGYVNLNSVQALLFIFVGEGVGVLCGLSSTCLELLGDIYQTTLNKVFA